MTLDEAIKHCENVADYDCYTDEQRKYSEDHRQLAEWLKLLKRIVDSGNCNVCAIQKMCNVRPEWGGRVRYNCHMFVEKEVDRNERSN